MTPEAIINLTDKAFIILLAVILCEYAIKIFQTYKKDNDETP